MLGYTTIRHLYSFIKNHSLNDDDPCSCAEPIPVVEKITTKLLCLYLQNGTGLLYNVSIHMEEAGEMETRIAENIRAYRKQRGLTQEQLAEVLGVSVGAVYKWEIGRAHV